MDMTIPQNRSGAGPSPDGVTPNAAGLYGSDQLYGAGIGPLRVHRGASKFVSKKFSGAPTGTGVGYSMIPFGVGAAGEGLPFAGLGNGKLFVGLLGKELIL